MESLCHEKTGFKKCITLPLGMSGIPEKFENITEKGIKYRLFLNINSFFNMRPY